MQTFDVSRITIREAIKTLVSRDVLEIRRGCGTFVSAVPGLSDDPLGLRFIASDDLNTYLFEARQILEPSVCRLAAQRGDAEELVLLKQLAEDIDELDAQLQGKNHPGGDPGHHRQGHCLPHLPVPHEQKPRL